MRFRSHSQRKAVMAKLNSARWKYKDSDGDGVPNGKDCQPFNPNKQGALHKWQMQRLKKQEEKLETKREEEQRKLEDLKDELKQRSKVSFKERNIKKAQLQQKQAVIDEINKEKRQAEALRKQNAAVKSELDKYTFTGKAKRFAGKVWKNEKEGAKIAAGGIKKGAKATAKWWNNPKTIKKRKQIAKSSAKTLKKTARYFGLTF